MEFLNNATHITDVGPRCWGHSPSKDGEGLFGYFADENGWFAVCGDCGDLEAFAAPDETDPSIRAVRAAHEHHRERLQRGCDETLHFKATC